MRIECSRATRARFLPRHCDDAPVAGGEVAAGRALRAEPTTASRRAAVRRYTDGIHAWGRGVLDSSHKSARYAATQAQVRGARSGFRPPRWLVRFVTGFGGGGR